MKKKKRRRMLPDWQLFERDQGAYLVLKYGMTAEDAAVYLGRPGRGAELQRYVDTRVRCTLAGTLHTKEELTIQCIEAAGNAISLAGRTTNVTRSSIDLPAGTIRGLQDVVAPPIPVLSRPVRNPLNLWAPTILIAIASIVAGIIVGVAVGLCL